jgi:hypothetical protein
MLELFGDGCRWLSKATHACADPHAPGAEDTVVSDSVGGRVLAFFPGGSELQS